MILLPLRKQSAVRTRRGAVLLLTLAMIAVTIAACFAMMHQQAVELKLASNASIRADARQAAQAGLSYAINRMHSADWAGVDAPLVRNLNTATSFAVTFATGDALLTAAEPDYIWLPYRVTVTSIGYAINPLEPTGVATHQASAVVQ